MQCFITHFFRTFIFQIASPAMTELEVVMMNWLGRMLELPEEFLNCSEGPGGGVIQVPTATIEVF